ncbi:Imm71 family immunity protein, partial [Caballeronia grimmiae]
MSTFCFLAGKNDVEARDCAFYLLKKYTSATLLQRAIGLYKQFLRDFEHEIKHPENATDAMQRSYQEDLVYFLRYLQPMEYAETFLADATRRAQSFALLRDAIEFKGFIWGRRYEEWGASEPGTLFYSLGYRSQPYDSQDVFEKAGLSAALISLASRTTSRRGIKRGIVRMSDKHDARRVMCWTFESIFMDTLPSNEILPIVFPRHLPSCPPPNANSDGQI